MTIVTPRNAITVPIVCLIVTYSPKILPTISPKSGDVAISVCAISGLA